MTLNEKIIEFLARAGDKIADLTDEIVDQDDNVIWDSEYVHIRIRQADQLSKLIRAFDSHFNEWSDKKKEMYVDHWSDVLKLNQYPVLLYDPLDAFEIPKVQIQGEVKLVELPSDGEGILRKEGDVLYWEPYSDIINLDQ